MHFQKVTANLVVRNVDASLKFYIETLGLERQITVPDQPPFVFVAVGSGDVEIFLNQEESAGKAKSGGISLFVEVDGLDQLLGRIQQASIKIEIALHETFYGMREFAVRDPDGYLLIFAERIKK